MRFISPIILMLGVVILSCNEDKFLDQVFYGNKLSFDYQPSSNYSLFIFSETGCPGCNKTYLNFIVENVINEKDMFICSAATGMRIDISSLLSDTIQNLIERDQALLDKNGFKNGSFFVEVVNNEIDTIIKIEVESIHQSLDYIANK